MESAVSMRIIMPANTMMAYTYRGDLFLLNLKTGVTTRITETEETEMNPRFINKDQMAGLFTKPESLYVESGNRPYKPNHQYSRNLIPFLVRVHLPKRLKMTASQKYSHRNSG
jgi:hypothetical protein